MSKGGCYSEKNKCVDLQRKKQITHNIGTDLTNLLLLLKHILLIFII